MTPKSRTAARKRALVVDAARRLHQALGRRPKITDYDEFREAGNKHLPATTTMYRMFDSWDEVLDLAGVDGGTPRDASAQYVAALKRAASALGTTVLSTHAYDEYRTVCGERLPSSSVIRKWMGGWDKALEMAGLESSQRNIRRSITQVEAVRAIRRAMGCVSPLTEAAYEALISEGEVLPEVALIMEHFYSWDAAIDAARRESEDDLHPHSPWTPYEIRRRARLAEQIVGAPLNQAKYELLLRRASKPMPPWSVVAETLGMDSPS